MYVGVGRWVWGVGCGEVGVGGVMENPTPIQNFTYLEPDSIISSLSNQLFSVIAVWFAKQIGGVGGGCRCGEVGVGVGRWVSVWGGGCGEVGVGGGYGCAEVGVGRWVSVWL